MGTTHVQVMVRHPADSSRTWSGRFLVDTGAMDSVVPESALRGLGIEPGTVRRYELADGAVRELGIGTGELEIQGEIVGTTVIFGADGAEPLLGRTALESAGFEVDPGSRTLRKHSAVRLKRARMGGAAFRQQHPGPRRSGLPSRRADCQIAAIYRSRGAQVE